MKSSYYSIPFKTESGLSQTDGIAKLSSAGIVLEFESKLFGLIKGGVKEFRIAMDEILDVKFRKGLLKLGARIEIRLKSLSKLSLLPSQNGKLSLKVKREDFQIAKEAVEGLQKDLEDFRADLPPTQTRVSSLFDDPKDLETKELDQD